MRHYRLAHRWAPSILAIAATMHSYLATAEGSRQVQESRFQIINDVDQTVSITLYPSLLADSLDPSDVRDWTCADTKSVALNGSATRFSIACGNVYAVRAEGGSLSLVILPSN
ncbi:Uncharacterised protein [Burkholderia pseudomallei]|uniref:hypothetical protein n=1 Tax=Burkholderia pseudomallei TaxID=28450 RepID=UPI000F1E9EBD|nr:hypothetical protein [Burkholderia pseudomallei]VBE31295.1 Uncharacterised protein [Burkholderia pseudomallei]